MAESNTSWLGQIASLLLEKRNTPDRRTRRLAAERLERRLVLCVAPYADELALAMSAVDESAEEALTNSETQQAEEETANQTLVDTSDPGATDYYFEQYLMAEGEGEPDPPPEDPPPEDPPPEDPPPEDPPPEDPPPEDPPPEDPPPEDPPPEDPPPEDPPPEDPPPEDPPPEDPPPQDEPPTISLSVLHQDNGTILITGSVSDDGSIGGLSVYLGGIAGGTFITDEYGNFSLIIDAPPDGGVVSASTTDDNGQDSDTVYVEC
jgi:hypothetical protein